jgi:3-hydroxyacyl-CoA dehydrogenase
MKQIVSTNIQDGIAVICVNNPPVNATSTALRQGLLDAVTTCESMSAKVAILYCKGPTFIAGGDMTEFNSPPTPPDLPDVVQAIEDSVVPWIAAMHGTVLGGGFEIAMGCAYRVAQANTRFALPEVNVGLIPGAGGTQRLPRLIGTKAAIDLTTSGRMIMATDLYDLGGLDMLSTAATALDAAKAFCTSRPDCPIVISQRKCDALSESSIKDLKTQVTHNSKGQQSPLHCLEATLMATRMPFKLGQPKERALHLALRNSAESRALRHVFFAERAVSKPTILGQSKPHSIAHVAVVGGGLMGAGIALSCLQAGLKVSLLEQDKDTADKGFDRVCSLINGAVKRAKITHENADKLLNNLQFGADYNLATNADIAIEAVFEDLGVKQAVFQRLADVMRPDAILATNTSYIDPVEIMQGISNASRCIGLHFFSPAHIMKLLEIVRLPDTDPAVIATGFVLAKRLRKVAVLSSICDGFIGNRILAAYRREADYLLMDGVKPEDIDAAMRAFGMPMGPYELQDLTGLQIAWANRKRQVTKRPAEERYVKVGDMLCEAGRLGQCSGAGWYRYNENSRTPIPDQYVTDLIKSLDAGRQSFSQDDIINRILAVIINEGGRIVEEGIAERAIDIDMVMIHGYGFPRWRGGPMHYATETGLERIKADMAQVALQSPKSWVISDMLK